MSEVFTVIVALLAAMGAVALLWVTAGAWLRSGSLDLPVFAVLYVPEKPADVQRAMRRLQWLRRWGDVDFKIVLADGGMADETRKQVELLRRDEPGLAVCDPSEVAGLIR